MYIYFLLTGENQCSDLQHIVFDIGSTSTRVGLSASVDPPTTFRSIITGLPDQIPSMHQPLSARPVRASAILSSVTLASLRKFEEPAYPVLSFHALRSLENTLKNSSEGSNTKKTYTAELVKKALVRGLLNHAFEALQHPFNMCVFVVDHFYDNKEGSDNSRDLIRSLLFENENVTGVMFGDCAYLSCLGSGRYVCFSIVVEPSFLS